MSSTDRIEAIRAVRRRISAECGHDAKRLVHHYQKMEQKYGERLRHRDEMKRVS